MAAVQGLVSPHLTRISTKGSTGSSSSCKAQYRDFFKGKSQVVFVGMSDVGKERSWRNISARKRDAASRRTRRRDTHVAASFRDVITVSPAVPNWCVTINREMNSVSRLKY